MCTNMFRRTIFLLLIGTLAFVTVAAQKKPAWKKYRSVEGRFSVIIPCQPDIKTEDLDNGHGTSKQIYQTCGNDDGYYLVSYIDLDVAKGDASLNEYRDGIVKGANASVVAENSISMGSVPGRDLVLVGRSAAGVLNYNLHLYLVGKRLYCVGTVTPTDKYDLPMINKFLSSFALEK